MTLLERWTQQMVDDAAKSLEGRRLTPLPLYWKTQQYNIGIVQPDGCPPDDLLSWPSRVGGQEIVVACEGPGLYLATGTLKGAFSHALQWAVGSAWPAMPTKQVKGAFESVQCVSEGTGLIMRGIMVYEIERDRSVVRFDVFLR